MAPPIRIAISGSGVAGAALMHALLQYSHLDVHIFESAADFKGAGLAVGVARNGLAALDLLGASAAWCLERAGAVPMRGVRFLIAQGDEAGDVADEMDDRPAAGEDATGRKRLTSIVHRAAFVEELLADVPVERMHASKKFDGVDRDGEDGPLTLRFADGTAHECDVLIGTDGIHSTVRKLVLGADDPAAAPRNTSVWCVMTVQPHAEARASLGDGVIDFEDAREYAWSGRGTYLMHNLLSDGKLVQFLTAVKDAEPSNQWRRIVRADEIRELYRDWPPHLYKAINEVWPFALNMWAWAKLRY